MVLLRSFNHVLLACVALASLGCTEQPPAGTGGQVDGARRDALPVEIERAEPKASPTRPPPFIAVNELRRALLPLGPTMGDVAIERGCVVFRRRSRTSTILWPFGTKVQQEGEGWAIRLPDDRLITLPSSRVTLVGAETALNREGMTKLTGKLAEGCPSSVYAVTLN